ncbi:MAG: efflux RND transporter permease subunit [Candidatus Kerfeldbacteria bacterium]
MEKNESFMTRWSKFFITRYRISILILITIVIAGIWGVTNNQRQDFPSVPINFIFVSAVYPGASPADVEQQVVVPIEQIATTMDTVDYVRSSTRNSFAHIQIILTDSSKIDESITTLTNEINKLRLPSEVETTIQTVDAAGPSIALGLVGNNDQTTEELLQYATAVKTELESSSNDIDRIEISPTNEYVIKITLDAAELSKYQLSYELIKSVIQSQIISLPGGSVEDELGIKKSITINAPIQTLEDIQNINLGRVSLKDVATITRSPKNIDSAHYVGYNKDEESFAKESVYFMVFKKDNGDVINIFNSVNEKIDEIEKSDILPDDINLVVSYSIAPYVKNQLDSLLNNGYIGLILILIVLLFFINLRTALVVALVIPIVILISLFLMKLLDFTLNILTLFAMILTLGILVDNAIVIAEGMVHELEKGAKKVQAALIAVRKLGPAVLAATLSTIVVFIPFANLGGIMGDFLKFIPFTIMLIIATSYFVALTIMPLLGSWILKEETYEERRAQKVKPWQKMLIIPAIIHYGQNAINNLTIAYANMMKKIFNKTYLKIGVIAFMAILLVISFGLFAPKLPFEQFPSKDGANIQTDFTFPSGMAFEDKEEVFIQVQNEIITLPYFETFYTFGDTIYATFTEPVDRHDNTEIFDIEVILDKNLDKIRSNISDDISIKAQAVTFGPPVSEYDIVVEFLGNTDESLANATNDLINFLNEDGSVSKIYNEREELLIPSIEVELNSANLTRLGVNSMIAAGTINSTFSPQNIGSVAVTSNGQSDDIIIEFSDLSTDSIDDLNNIIIPSTTRGFVKLSEVAEVKNVETPISITRLDGERAATINIAVNENADVALLNTKIIDYLTENKLEEYGLTKDGVKYGGEYSEFTGDFENLQIIFLLAMVAVYLILVWQFYSYFQPALILFAVPLALIGVFPGLMLVGSSLNMISGLGVIALVGIVVNDAIVLIAAFNRYRQEFPEETMTELLVRTGRSRFKPIFSTSITTIGGILPLTIYDPFWTGLGTAIITGLVFSTIGTLVAIPVLYSLADSAGKFCKRMVIKKKV